MILPVLFLVVVATVPVLGGRLGRVAELRFEKAWLVGAALGMQFLVIGAPAEVIPVVISAAVHLLSYGLLIVFILVNRRVSGLTVLVVGGMLNLVAIGANGGVMPASAGALETAGIPVDSGDFANSAPIEDARFWFLGDIFAVPEGVPLANVFSVGDVILLIGAGVFLHSTAGSRLPRRRSRVETQERDRDRAGVGG